MDIILYFFRDKITGTYYFIYAFICLMLMFAIIGYLYKQKYAKVEVKLNTSQPKKESNINDNNQVKVEKINNQKLNLFQKNEDGKISVHSNTSNPTSSIESVNTNQIINSTINQNVTKSLTDTMPKTPVVNQTNIISNQVNSSFSDIIPEKK